MKYFELEVGSANFCGFNSTFMLKGETESEVESSKEYEDIMDYMQDYVTGWIDEGDWEEHGEEADMLSINISETTEEAFLAHGENQY